MGHYSKDCPKPKLGNGGSKVIALTANLAQGECNCLIFLKGKVSKWDVLCFLDTRASHNFITQESAKRMELQLKELKAPIEMHFAHPTTLQTKDVPLQLRNWKRKVDLLVSTLGGMDCILGMKFITHNNVFIKGHNRLVRIPSNNQVVQVKAHEVPSVGGSTIHLMLGKTLEKEATNLVSFIKCVKRVFDEFPNVMPKKLPDELPPKRQVDHAIEVMLRVAPRQGPILNES
jgi:hypothetical protein